MDRVPFLILEHAASEGPGIFESLLQKDAIALTRIRLFEGDVIPWEKKPGGVLIMGGSMNVYEETAYPFLKEEDAFIKHCLSCNIPLLGICLGAQLIAKAAGAKIMKAPVKELGWCQVQLTDKGSRDALFQGFEKVFDVFQFHEDTFTMPCGAVHLVESPECPQQGFTIGDNVYGLQFHLEATRDMICQWLDGEDLSFMAGGSFEAKKKILMDTDAKVDICHRNAQEIFLKFLKKCRL